MQQSCTPQEEQLNLPARQLIQTRNESDYYGATSLIAEGLGLDPMNPPLALANWLHYPLPAWMELQVPYDVHNHKTFGVPRQMRPLLVPTTHSQDFMRSHGYSMATAVGAPFLYAMHYLQPRIHGSRLIMPEHTLAYMTYSKDARTTISRLISTTMETKNDFTTTVFCLHPEDVKRGLWPDALDGAGIPWVAGAEKSDSNALRRLVALLSQFEMVVTNNVGSHIVYAWHLGCKVKLEVVGKMHDSQSDVDNYYLKNHPLGAEANSAKLGAMTNDDLENLAKDYGMSDESSDLETQRQFSDLALGAHSKRNLEDMFDLLGWRKGSRVWITSQFTIHDRVARKFKRWARSKFSKAAG